MKKRLYIFVIALVAGSATAVLAQDFNTGSSLMNTGSSYSSNVGEVGAASAAAMYETTEVTSTRKRGRTSFDTGAETGQSSESPIGAPWVMLLLASGYGVSLAARKHKQA